MRCLATALLCAARARGGRWCWCDRGLRHRQPGFIGLETRNTNVVIPLEVKLEIPHFERVTTTVFGEAAGKIRDRVDKLVRNVEQQLGEHHVGQRSRVSRCGGSHLLHLVRSLHLGQCLTPSPGWTSAYFDPPRNSSSEAHDCRPDSTSPLILSSFVQVSLRGVG